jgi:hypothetical protein
MNVWILEFITGEVLAQYCRSAVPGAIDLAPDRGEDAAPAIRIFAMIW